jgi:hypothetical protein
MSLEPGWAPFDPRADRQRALVAFLRLAGVITFALACVGLLPGDLGRLARGGVVAVLVGAPLVRVGWLATRWARKGDARYAAVSLAVIAVVGLSALVA